MDGFVFVDKPEGLSSFVLAAKVRRIFGEKKSGHTGTLDPAATGVMVVALSGATRFIELIPDGKRPIAQNSSSAKQPTLSTAPGRFFQPARRRSAKTSFKRRLSRFSARACSFRRCIRRSRRTAFGFMSSQDEAKALKEKSEKSKFLSFLSSPLTRKAKAGKFSSPALPGHISVRSSPTSARLSPAAQ